MAVGEDLLDVGADFAAHRRAGGEERVVGRRACRPSFSRRITPVRVRVVRRGSAERVVHLRRREERAVRQVLQPAAAALVAHEQVELAVGPELQHAAVVIAVLAAALVVPGCPGTAMLSVCRERSLMRLRSNVSVEPFQTKRSTRLPEQRHVEHRAGVRAGAALRPADVDERRRREIRDASTMLRSRARSSS